MKTRAVTESTEEYLEAILRLVQKGGKPTTTNIARMVSVTPASASEMLNKLSQQGYIRYRPYGSAVLTRKGESIGKRILKKHRLLERFLEGMGLSKSRIHDEACRLEHYVSDELEGIIRSRMEPPRTGRGIMTLIDLQKGQEGEIFHIEGGRGFARRLEDMGLTPGARVRILREAPFSGPVEICVRDSCLVIGRGMAKKIFVKV